MDRNELTSRLNTIKKLADECIAALSVEGHNEGKRGADPIVRQAVPAESPALAIVNKVKNCPESSKIETNILDRTGVPGRVLLPLYICYKYFPQQGLTTGNIEKITSELRVKVKTSNVSKVITDSLQKYVDGNSIRTRGKAVVYKLNRKGAQFFESLLNGDKTK